MTVKMITVGIAEDAIEQLAKVALDRAIEELIWNSLDAEATRVEVTFHSNSMQGVERIVVSDNGHGIPFDQAESIFKQIGGSPKKTPVAVPTWTDRTTANKERAATRRSRLAAASLGRAASWTAAG